MHNSQPAKSASASCNAFCQKFNHIFKPGLFRFVSDVNIYPLDICGGYDPALHTLHVNSQNEHLSNLIDITPTLLILFDK